ncbi:Formate-tetrahydrofolate ligase [Theobroma cacao]|nr:Formate-tetrahydrofolate ligase [Theobroma cacao]
MSHPNQIGLSLIHYARHIKKEKRNSVPSCLDYRRSLASPKHNLRTLHQKKLKKFAGIEIDPNSFTWRRVMDVNDQLLRRKITVGLGPEEEGVIRETGFDISVAGEIMAVLALTTSLAE